MYRPIYTRYIQYYKVLQYYNYLVTYVNINLIYS